MSQVSQEQSSRIVSIQVCRGLAALLVVLAHLHGIENKYCATDHLRLFDHGALGVDLFFVISGVVIASVTAGKFANPRNAGIFLYHRLARIFPIFWIYTTSPSSPATSSAHQQSEPAPASSISCFLSPDPNPPAHAAPSRLDPQLRALLLPRLPSPPSLIPERLAPWLLALWGVAVIALKLHIGLSPLPIVQLLISPSVLEFLAGCAPLPSLPPLPPASRCRHPPPRHLAPATRRHHASTAHIRSDHIVDHPWRRPLLYGTFSALFLLGAFELERTSIIRYLPVLSPSATGPTPSTSSHALVLELIARLFLPPTQPPLPHHPHRTSRSPPRRLSQLRLPRTPPPPSPLQIRSPTLKPPPKQPA